MRGFAPRERRRVQLDTGSESHVKQSMRDECDVNMIIKKYRQTGVMTHVQKGVPQYGDFSDVGDYAGCLAIVRRGEEIFAALPSAIREKFRNDPALFVDFAMDPANKDALISMGLMEASKKPDVEPVPSPVPEAPSKKKKEPAE